MQKNAYIKEEMKMKPEILFLKQEDLIKAGLLDMPLILEAAEHTYKMLGEGKVIQPAKIQLPIPDKKNWTSYGMSMPAYIGGDEEVMGFKWAAESVYNTTLPGVPYGIDIVILSEPKTMFPKAVLDGTITTAMRTSACAGVFAKYCADPDSEVVTLVGAGVIGRTMIMAMGAALKNIKEIRLFDLDMTKAESLAEEFKGQYNVVPAADLKKACEGADIVVTETTARKPFIDGAWIRQNATCIQMEAYSFPEEFLLKNDALYMDSWEQISHMRESVKKYAEAGKLHETDVIEIKDLCTGAAPGRTNKDQFIFCTSMGMGCVDIAIANKLYLKAKEIGVGTKLSLWDDPLWV